MIQQFVKIPNFWKSSRSGCPLFGGFFVHSLGELINLNTDDYWRKCRSQPFVVDYTFAYFPFLALICLCHSLGSSVVILPFCWCLQVFHGTNQIGWKRSRKIRLGQRGFLSSVKMTLGSVSSFRLWNRTHKKTKSFEEKKKVSTRVGKGANQRLFAFWIHTIRLYPTLGFFLWCLQIQFWHLYHICSNSAALLFIFLPSFFSYEHEMISRRNGKKAGQGNSLVQICGDQRNFWLFFLVLSVLLIGIDLCSATCTPSCVNGICDSNNQCNCTSGWQGATCNQGNLFQSFCWLQIPQLLGVVHHLAKTMASVKTVFATALEVTLVSFTVEIIFNSDLGPSCGTAPASASSLTVIITASSTGTT